MHCAICKAKTKEFLVLTPSRWKLLFFSWEAATTVNLCREHLIARFKEEFTKARHRAVVFHPNLEEEHGNYQYRFITTTRLYKGYAADPTTNGKILALLDGWLNAVKGRCVSCSFPGEVVYFPRDSIRWERVPAFLGNCFDLPLIQDVVDPPDVLCRRCAFARIERSLRSSPRGFEGGIICHVGNADGIYITLEAGH